MQPTHLLFVLVVALLVLGPKRLPEVGRTLGSGIRDFRQALSGESPERPQDREPEQVPSTAHGPEHQPDYTEDHEVMWPEEAVGPATYDEPVEAASATPASSATSADSATPASSATPADSAAPAHPAPGHAESLDDVPLDEASALRASAEATRIVAPGASTAADGSSEPQTGSSV